MSIEIPGLSARQIDLANRIWSMESMEEVLHSLTPCHSVPGSMPMWCTA